MFRLLVLAAAFTALSCKSWEPTDSSSVTELLTMPNDRSLEANDGSARQPSYKRSLESPSPQVAHNPSTPAANLPSATPTVLQTTLSGISITAVTFDSRTHRLDIADQADGPGSRWTDAATAGRALGGIAAVNGGFFTPEGKPLGLVVTGGKRLSPVNRASSLGAGLFVGGNSPALLRREHGSNASEVLQSGPFLVENGRVISGLSQDSSTARTILGWDGGHGWFIARTGACSLAGLGQALAGAKISGVKAHTVLNLDGGRSSDLWVASSVPGGPLSQRPLWNKPVRNFLVVVAR